MSDHELCLLAAKAAGYTVEERWAAQMVRTYEDGISALWNPLDFSSCAFELMVDCGLAVSTAAGSASATLHRGDGSVEWFFVPFGTDKHAATRRVIVRAAAGASDAELRHRPLHRLRQPRAQWTKPALS